MAGTHASGCDSTVGIKAGLLPEQMADLGWNIQASNIKGSKVHLPIPAQGLQPCAGMDMQCFLFVVLA